MAFFVGDLLKKAVVIGVRAISDFRLRSHYVD
jgi:hypothetical protein